MRLVKYQDITRLGGKTADHICTQEEGISIDRIGGFVPISKRHKSERSLIRNVVHPAVGGRGPAAIRTQRDLPPCPNTGCRRDKQGLVCHKRELVVTDNMSTAGTLLVEP